MEGAVGAMLVVMTDVDREDAFEVPSVHDQDPVETFATYGADPPFDERVRARCPVGVENPDSAPKSEFPRLTGGQRAALTSKDAA